MTQEEKELLLKDLCARLPYKLTCKVSYIINNETTDGEDIPAVCDDELIRLDFDYESAYFDWLNEYVDIEDVKPYLRPLSSMTKKEIDEYHKRCEFNDCDYTGEPMYFNTLDSFDYLYSIHVDCRDLIPMGLALEAPEGMYN